MVTARLRWLTLAGIVLMVLHGVEEWVSGFYRIDPTFELAATWVGSKEEALFLSFQLTWWLLLALFGLLTFSARWRLRGLGLFGAIMVFEWTHLIPSIRALKYVAGAGTAAVFVPLAILFWVEYARVYRCATHCAVCSRPLDLVEVVPTASGLVGVCSAACRTHLHGLTA